MYTLRQAKGLCGFTRREESEYDVFGAGHSSTSLSAALGIAVVRDITHENYEVVSVIGDGAISAGMAYEAINNAGALKSRIIVILNDNKMSISPAVGAMSNYLSRLLSSSSYLTLRSMAKNIAGHLPGMVNKVARDAEKYARVRGSNIFEDMGFYYIGPLNGHDLNCLVKVFENICKDHTIRKPILIHTVTEKGRGFKSIEKSQESYHAIGKFDLATGKQHRKSITYLTCSDVFGKVLDHLAYKDDKIIAITAAMRSGTGLKHFSHTKRIFDVGIAEQHAVTFAAGLACAGYKPFCALYSTFLQRAYDQVIHDVAIQKLPVRFMLDRAGLVGSDGATHAGSFDLAYLLAIPGFIVMVPSSESVLRDMIFTAVKIDHMPLAIRYPRGSITRITEFAFDQGKEIALGTGKIICQGKDIAILSLGSRLSEALRAAEILREQNKILCTVADARFAKPLDSDLLFTLIKDHKALIIVEEGVRGGFGAHALQLLAETSLLHPRIRTLCFPDKFIEQGEVNKLYEEIGLNVDNIVKTAMELFD